MKAKYLLYIITSVILLSLILSACGNGEPPLSEEQQLATVVASTMTAMEAATESSIAPESETTGALRPLADNCAEFKTILEAVLAVPVGVETVPVTMSWSGDTGSACQLLGITDGNQFQNPQEAYLNLQGMMRINGWEESMTLPCLGHGGAGPAASQSCYTVEDKVCEIMITAEPNDMALCEGIDGPINNCLAALPPEQIKFTTRMTCAEGGSSMAFGRIIGQAHMLDPYTPAMTIYAVNSATGEWFSTDVPANPNGPADFTLEVAPGTYQIFSSMGSGYATEDGLTLTTVAVETGQTIANVLVSPPGQFECGSMYGIPASPDGLRPAISGPSQECIATLTLPKTEPTRIEFTPGAVSAQVSDSLGPQGLGQYVLYAMQDQVMTVNLYPTRPAVLVIWGLDGTVLISDHAGATTWTGTLPLSQDYYIDVRSQSGETQNYTLGVSIPPAKATVSGQVFPKIEPFSFGYMQPITGMGVPPMLPPEFPTQAGQPEIVPYSITMENGKYVFSLDYGTDCMGAGYCHLGVIGGMQTTSSVPTHFNTYYPFEAERAEQVPLLNGITGYFIESTCGANCNDATIWWIYNGYQYMLGIKAGPKDMVVALANAAIANSIP